MSGPDIGSPDNSENQREKREEAGDDNGDDDDDDIVVVITQCEYSVALFRARLVRVRETA